MRGGSTDTSRGTAAGVVEWYRASYWPVPRRSASHTRLDAMRTTACSRCEPVQVMQDASRNTSTCVFVAIHVDERRRNRTLAWTWWCARNKKETRTNVEDVRGGAGVWKRTMRTNRDVRRCDASCVAPVPFVDAATSRVRGTMQRTCTSSHALVPTTPRAKPKAMEPGSARPCHGHGNRVSWMKPRREQDRVAPIAVHGNQRKERNRRIGNTAVEDFCHVLLRN
mmetsp:Transcript_6309/g.39309  ORF Transcript_6309/g.39309 Transcript_6309/m.39309 type:complete len:224 (+) Transcript_6309:2588-3259(+)